MSPILDDGAGWKGTEYGMTAECRTAQVQTAVGAPLTSPRPLPKPEGRE